MATLTKAKNGAKEIFYCPVASCSELSFSPAEQARHVAGRHTTAAADLAWLQRCEETRRLEEEFSFDTGDDEEEEADTVNHTPPPVEDLPTAAAKPQETTLKMGDTGVKSEKRKYMKKEKPTSSSQPRTKAKKPKLKSLKSAQGNVLKAEKKLPPVVCPDCGKCYANKYILKTHRKSFHSEQKDFNHHNNNTKSLEPLPCTRCPKTFHNKYNLKYHEGTHEAPRFLCTDCPQAFRRKNFFQRHQYLAHGKEFNIPIFNCDECGKIFYIKNDLTNHVKYHQKHPDLTCKDCGKYFTKAINVKNHVKHVHSLVKNLSCHLCTYKTSRKEKLNIHIQKVHEQQMETCLICKSQVKYLYQHIRNFHKGGDNFKLHKKLKMESLFQANEPKILDVKPKEIVSQK